MKDPWEKTEFAPRRLRAFLDLVRPFTLLAPLLGGLSGAFLGLIIQGDLGWPVLSSSFPLIRWPGLPLYLVVSGVTSLIFLNAASNSLNQVFDRHIDRINKPYRPIPSKLITPKEGIWIAVILYSLAIWRAAMVNRIFVVMISILILLTIFYSVPPLRLKKHLWISNLSIALPRGMLGIVAAWTITAEIGDPIPWTIGSVLAVFLVGSTTTKDITDIEGDRLFNMRTLPVEYGKMKAILFSSPFLVIPHLMIGIYWYLDILPDGSLVMAGIFTFWSLILIYLLVKEGDKEDKHFENSPAWKQMYLMLMCMQIGFLAVFIIG